MNIGLKISSDLAKLEPKLQKMAAQTRLAIARGLNEGGDLVRTRVRRAMLQQTSLLKLQSVTRRSSTMRAYVSGFAPKGSVVGTAGPERPGEAQGPVKGGSLSYTIVFRGKPATRPIEFAWRVKTGPGGGVTIRMWGVDHKLKRSFMEKLHPGAGGLRARLGASKFPIRGFAGPNLAKEAVKDQVAATFLAESQSLVPPMIDKHLAKLL